MQPEVLAPRALTPELTPNWRSSLTGLGVAAACLIALAWQDWRAMAHQWWDISTYNHILLVPFIAAWLVRMRASEVRQLSPRAWWPGVVLTGMAGAVWVAGTLSGVNLVSQGAAVIMLQAAVVAVLGVRVSLALLFPIAYLLFLVPFGDEIVPQLQAVTANLAISLTHLSGVPATINGVFIDTPAGLFEVAEACSGVKFLVAMVALGALVTNLGFRSWRRRFAWMAAAVLVPIVANGIRAWGTIYVAQFHGIEFAAGFDHIVYGWVFFAVVMGGMLGIGWRHFDRNPDDPLVDDQAIRRRWVDRLEQLSFGPWYAVAAICAVGLAAATAVRAAEALY